MRTTSFRHQRIAGRALLRTQGGPVLYRSRGGGWMPIVAVVNDHWKSDDPNSDPGLQLEIDAVTALVHVDDVPNPNAAIAADRADAVSVGGTTYQVTVAREHKMGLWRLKLVEPTREDL